MSRITISSEYPHANDTLWLILLASYCLSHSRFRLDEAETNPQATGEHGETSGAPLVVVTEWRTGAEATQRGESGRATLERRKGKPLLVNYVRSRISKEARLTKILLG
jgi:hypothetical protein